MFRKVDVVINDFVHDFVHHTKIEIFPIINGILMFHVYNSLDLCSFMDMSFTSVLIWIYICSFMGVMFNQPI